MIGIDNDEIVYVPLTRATKIQKRVPQDLIDLMKQLSV